MASTIVLVGTRKGCFVLESDEDRRDWKCPRPVLRGLADLPRRARPGLRATIYAAAASEWHGAGVWRSNDLGETWELSSEGLGYARRRPEALEDLRASRPRTGACSPAPRSAGVFESRDGGVDVVAAQHARRPAGPRRLERPGEPAARPSRPAGDPAAPGRPVALSASSSRESASSRRRTTARRGRRATAACAPTGRARSRRSASASTSS